MSEAALKMPRQGKLLVELTRRDCRWVCEEPSEENGQEWLYCGERSKSETCAYCETHHKIMFEPPQPKGAKRLRVVHGRRT